MSGELILPWDSQPPIGTPVDKSSDFSRGLVECIIGPGDSASNDGYIFPSGYTAMHTPAGLSMNIIGASSQHSVKTTSRLPSSHNVTVLMMHLPAPNTAGNGLFDLSFDTNNALGLMTAVGSRYNVEYLVAGVNYGAARAYTYTVGRPTTVAVSWDDAEFIMYNNGRYQDSPGVYPLMTNLNTIRWGRRTMTGLNYTGDFLLRLVWDRVLTRSDLVALTNNPWQIFEPRKIPTNARRPAKRKLWDMPISFRSDAISPESLEPNPVNAEGMCFLWSGKFHRNELITGKRSVNGVATQTVDAQGLVAQCYDTNQNIEWPGQFITTSDDVGTGDFTITIIANPSIGPGVEYLLSQKNDSAGYPYAQCILLANSDANGNYSAGSACFYTYSGSQVSCAAASQVDGNYHVWAGVRVGTVLQLWRDGVLVASSSGVIQGLVQADRSMNIGSRGNNTSESFRGRALAAAAWNRALSPEEIGKYRSPQEAQALLFKPIDIPVNAGTLVTTRREVGHMELPWGGQPNEPCEIDRANPLTNGLVTAWHAGDLTGVAGGGVYTLSGTASRGLSRLGLEVTSKMNGYANNGIVVSGATPVRTSRATVLMFTSGIGASNYERGNLAYSYDWSFQFDPTTRKMRFGFQGGGYYDTGAAIPLNAPCMVGASIVSSGNTVYYLNGVVNSTAGPDAGYEYESAIAGAGGASGYGSTNAGLLAIFVFNRILSPAEVNALYLEPWQVFKPKTLTSDQPALIRQLEPLTPTDGYTPRILLEQ